MSTSDASLSEWTCLSSQSEFFQEHAAYRQPNAACFGHSISVIMVHQIFRGPLQNHRIFIHSRFSRRDGFLSSLLTALFSRLLGADSTSAPPYTRRIYGAALSRWLRAPELTMGIEYYFVLQEGPHNFRKITSSL